MDRDSVLVLVCDFAERITQLIWKGNTGRGLFMRLVPCYAIGASAIQWKQKSRAEITLVPLRFSLQKLLHIEITPNYLKWMEIMRFKFPKLWQAQH